MEKVFHYLHQLEKWIAAFCAACLTLLIITDVITREGFELGLPWAQKAAVYFMIWMGFLGAIMMSHKNEHLRPEFADKIFKGKLSVIVPRLQHLVTAAFTGLLAYSAYVYVLETREFGDMNVILDVAMWKLQLVIPYAFFSMTLRHLYYVYKLPVKTERSLH